MCSGARNRSTSNPLYTNLDRYTGNRKKKAWFELGNYIAQPMPLWCPGGSPYSAMLLHGSMVHPMINGPSRKIERDTAWLNGPLGKPRILIGNSI